MSRLCFLLSLLSRFFVVVSGFRFQNTFRVQRCSNVWTSNQKLISLSSSLFSMSSLDDDDDEALFLARVKSNYLINKFRDCRKSTSNSAEEECRTLCTQAEMESLLRSILPPVSNKEMNQEIQLLLKKIPSKSIQSNSIDFNDFLTAVSENSFWKRAGDLVVKELIFFDCLHAYYYDKQVLLKDDDYNELKENLSWEGSVAVTMTGKEAHFIKAISVFQSKQKSILSDSEYDTLKRELSAEKSWVVNRVQDPLERMGVDTFMKYLHRAL